MSVKRGSVSSGCSSGRLPRCVWEERETCGCFLAGKRCPGFLLVPTARSGRQATHPHLDFRFSKWCQVQVVGEAGLRRPHEGTEEASSFRRDAFLPWNPVSAVLLPLRFWFCDFAGLICWAYSGLCVPSWDLVSLCVPGAWPVCLSLCSQLGSSGPWLWRAFPRGSECRSIPALTPEG